MCTLIYISHKMTLRYKQMCGQLKQLSIINIWKIQTAPTGFKPNKLRQNATQLGAMNKTYLLEVGDIDES